MQRRDLGHLDKDCFHYSPKSSESKTRGKLSAFLGHKLKVNVENQENQQLQLLLLALEIKTKWKMTLREEVARMRRGRCFSLRVIRYTGLRTLHERL